METIYQTSGKNIMYSVTGNGQFGAVKRTGWSLSKLGDVKKKIIREALEHHDTNSVYKKGQSIYRLLLNGVEEKIA